MSLVCRKCGAPVVSDAVGLNKKLINRGIGDFFCLKCLGEHFEITERQLLSMADRYREAGCMLFAPKKKERIDPCL